MTFDVTVNGRPWRVAVDPASRVGQFSVVIKGRRRLVDASWITPDTVSLIDGGAQRELRLQKRPDGAFDVAVGGQTFHAVVSTRRGEHVVGSDPPSSPASGPQPLKAPMPGRVVRVLASVGECVVLRQGLVVVEAMKMENELRSPRAGVVTEVRVTPGTAVEAGTVLVVVGDTE